MDDDDDDDDNDNDNHRQLYLPTVTITIKPSKLSELVKFLTFIFEVPSSKNNRDNNNPE
jgi:hypothetical protein